MPKNSRWPFSILSNVLYTKSLNIKFKVLFKCYVLTIWLSILAGNSDIKEITFFKALYLDFIYLFLDFWNSL